MKPIRSWKRACIALLLAVLLLFPTVLSADAEYNSSYFLLQDIIDIFLNESLYEVEDRDTLIDTMLYNYLRDNPYMLGAMANALLSSGDSYSRYYTAQDGFLSADAGGYGLILSDIRDPAVLDGRPAGIYIDRPAADSNARFAGVLPGDRVAAVEGMDVSGLTLAGLKYLLALLPLHNKDPLQSATCAFYGDLGNRTPENIAAFDDFMYLDWNPKKEVDFTFARMGEDGKETLIDLSFPRGAFTASDVYSSLDPTHSEAYIEITAFATDTTVDDFKEALYEAQEAGCKNLILDLRDNFGGIFESAIAIADLFVPGGVDMFYTQDRGGEYTAYTATEACIRDAFDKIVVLVNSNTVSAAEILACILQDHADAVLVGEMTYGKGVGQQAYTIPNGDTFTVTTFRILRGDKTSYHEIGLVPNITLPQAHEHYDFPQGLPYFNHTNYVTVTADAENDTVLALEKRFVILGLMHEEAADGLCDDATRVCTLLFRALYMDEAEPGYDVTYDMVTRMTEVINGYKDIDILVDSQLAVAEKYLENASQAKRLASEYINAEKQYQKKLEAREEQNRKELEELLRQEAEENTEEE